MNNDGESRFLPLSFYDGKCEINIGQVRIQSSLDYKTFQSILSQKIGISPNQMSIYFVDRNNNTKLIHQRRILITGKASFNLILQGKDCSVLVVLKRSKNQRSKLSTVAKSSYYFPEADNFNVVVPDYYACPPVWPCYDQIAVHELYDYKINRFRNMYNYYPIFEERDHYRYCDECMNARSQGKVVQFHLCVDDAVTVSFRSPAGPVARPGGC